MTVKVPTNTCLTVGSRSGIQNWLCLHFTSLWSLFAFQQYSYSLLPRVILLQKIKLVALTLKGYPWCCLPRNYLPNCPKVKCLRNRRCLFQKCLGGLPTLCLNVPFLRYLSLPLINRVLTVFQKNLFGHFCPSSPSCGAFHTLGYMPTVSTPGIGNRFTASIMPDTCIQKTHASI